MVGCIQYFEDIQELYEDTLLNERKSLEQKTYETRRIAQRWETNPPFGRINAPLASLVNLFFLQKFCYLYDY